MNREDFVNTLDDLIADATKLRDAVKDGLLVRVRDSFPGHPKSPSLDPSPSSGPKQDDPSKPLEYLPDELRGADTHSDPTGSAAVQSLNYGNRGRDDARGLAKDVAAARKALRSAVDTARRYSARQPNVVDRALITANAKQEPGCASCERIPGPSGGAPYWNAVVRTTTLANGERAGLCDWCYDTPRVGARWTGQLPPVDEVKHYRDNGRARKRSA